MAKLTKKEEKFVDEYMIDLNGRRAYMASFGTKNEHSARTQASRLLAKPDIQATIDARLNDMKKQYKGVREKIIERNLNILFQDYTNIVNSKDNFVIVKNTDELTREQKECIKSVIQTRDGVKIEFESKEKAEETIIRLLGLDKEKEQNFFDTELLKGLTREDLLKIAFEKDGEEDEE